MKFKVTAVLWFSCTDFSALPTIGGRCESTSHSSTNFFRGSAEPWEFAPQQHNELHRHDRGSARISIRGAPFKGLPSQPFQGFLIEEQRLTYLAEADRDSALLPLQAASCTYRIAHGPRAGQKVLSLQNVPDKPSTSDLCANAHGFSLHAAVCWGADQRKELEHLCRYITRPAMSCCN
jgi:hypothetical protein